ncbi:ABC transporter substrate-binding protein [Corynebacterium mendelii]|uniref:ABC transporter substrate-binding protein n=1 Tax=Corynebacterium mendelii TaxID=2765362 RepID=A0A939DZ41_9CORY|nr:ABC transporter substrate-binding protein [Corynebacterium mendelii]MBN9643693.1 ABC transporter substrate-binding protein [Corynebacterium mendelii]
MRTSSLKRRSLPAAAIVVTSALVLAACGGGTDAPSATDAGSSSDSTAAKDADTATDSSTITAAVAYDTDNYDPSNTTSALALAANWHTMEGLTELDPATREVYPALAGALAEQVDDTTWEATLRDGAKFSDGTDVTTDDVVNAFTMTMEGFYAPFLSFIDSVEKKDDTTVTIKTKFPFSLVNERISLVKVFPASQSADELKSKPIGTGPYKMTSAIKSKAVDFEKNDNYNGTRPAGAAKMHWDIQVDGTPRVTSMTTNTVMAMESVPAINEQQLKDSGATVESVQGFGLPFVMFNTKKAPFDNPKVRQAVLYGINTEQLIDNVLDGKAQPATSFLQESHPNYHKASNVYNYDPEKSKQLLKEAGVEDLHFTLNTTDHPWVSQLAPIIKANLEEAGITVDKIDSQASGAMYSNVTDVDDPQFDVVVAPGDPSVFGNDPDLLMNWWYGDNAWTQKRSQWKGSDGYTKLHDLMDKAVRATGDEQQDLWNQCFDVISEEVPIYPLFHRAVTTAWNGDKLSGFQPSALTGMSFLDVKVK